MAFVLLALLCVLANAENRNPTVDVNPSNLTPLYAVKQTSAHTGSAFFDKESAYLPNLNTPNGSQNLEREGRGRVDRGQKTNATSRTNRGFQGTIHSVVVEGKFGHPLTQNINKTLEYLFEFTYNSTVLEVCEAIFLELQD